MFDFSLASIHHYPVQRSLVSLADSQLPLTMNLEREMESKSGQGEEQMVPLKEAAAYWSRGCSG